MVSKSDGKLKFLNHACYYVQSKNSILICDPWLEGLAFNNGWSLLDNSSSNIGTIKELLDLNKKIYIWYSHEHSDHFSISFLKELIKFNGLFTVLYQKTFDKRIINFLKTKNIKTIEAINGGEISIDNQLSINIWAHKNGDSFSLLSYENIKILNLNDCIVSNKKEAMNISKKINKVTNDIDILFTQFGYANWIGNKNDNNLRLKASTEKQNRILIQNSNFSPKIIIPYASFISFCDKDNFYLNLEQNTPRKIKNSSLLKSINNKIFFLKPEDNINLKKYKDEFRNLEMISNRAINYWEILFDDAKPTTKSEKVVDINILKNESKKFLNLINKSFFFLPAILEFLRLIKPVSIYIKDIEKKFRYSYLTNLIILDDGEWDIKTNSDNLLYSLRYEYGFNTLRVNGKFEVSNMNSYLNFVYFYYFQDLYKESITFKNPLNLLKKIFQISIIFIKNILSFKI